MWLVGFLHELPLRMGLHDLRSAGLVETEQLRECGK